MWLHLIVELCSPHMCMQIGTIEFEFFDVIREMLLIDDVSMDVTVGGRLLVHSSCIE